jgi:polysaccharide export outer membrane protein
MKMKKIFLPMVVLTMILMLGSCGSTKQVAYFQNADSISYAASKGLYDAKIMPKDMLTIIVTASDPQAAAPFNISVRNTMNASGGLSSNAGSMLTYMVDNDGNINFPIVGTLHVEGLTVRQCEDLVKQKIKPYMSQTENPIVTVRMASFKITVLGEVGRPGQITISTAKVNLLEALAQAGDLSIYGRRDNVMLIREDASGQKSIHRINLNDANLINQQNLFYLQQNDVVYVEPNKIKAQNASIGQITTLSISSISLLITVSNFIINLLRK